MCVCVLGSIYNNNNTDTLTDWYKSEYMRFNSE